MRFIFYLILVLATAFVQISIFGQWRPFGVMPNLMLILIICLALWSSASVAVAGAVTGGLMLDLSSGADFGLRTAFYTLIALMVIAGKQFGLHPDSILSAMVLVMVGSILFDLSVLSTLGGQTIDWAYVVAKTSWQVVLNSVILLMVFAGRIVLSGRRTRISSELKRKSWL